MTAVVPVESFADRAAELHAAALTASDNGRPAVAVRQLRAGLALIGSDPASDPPAVAQIRGRLLISLAWAESERGRVEVGFGLLDEAELHIPPAQRPILLAQRGLLLKRSGRNEEALRQYDEAVALLTGSSGGLDSPLDLVKVLNNRSLVHVEAGHIRLARADLRRCGQIADRHGLALHSALSRVNLGCMDVLAGDLPSALGAFTAARAEYERLAPGRLAALAVERARALVAAGLFIEADAELAGAIEQAAAQGLSHTYADAVQVRAEAALLAGRPAAAAQWARLARARFQERGNVRRAGLASLLELRAEFAVASRGSASGSGAADRSGGARGSDGADGSGGAGGLGAIAGRGQVLAGRLAELGLAEDARVSGLVAARALISAGRYGRAARIAGRYGTPGKLDRLDTRLLWRLTRAELAADPAGPAGSAGPVGRVAGPVDPADLTDHTGPFGHVGPTGITGGGRRGEASRHLLAGMAALHRHRAQFGCLDLQTGAAVHGQDLARAGLAAALASGSPAAVYRWAERSRAQALLLPALRPPADPIAAAAIEELRQARHALRARELGGQPTSDLRGRVEALQRRVREQSWAVPGRRGQPVPAPAPLGAVRADLGDSALISYIKDGRWLRALVVVGGSASLRSLGEYAAAEEAVLRLRADLDVQAGRALDGRLASAVAAATRHDAAVLASAVISPLLPHVGDRDLVVIPTGVLTTVPWAVLPGCAGRPVTVAPSATAWLAARRRLGAGGRAVGLANQSGSDAPAATLLVAGPGNARGESEVRAIAALRPGASVLTGPTATPTATLDGLGSAAVAHLAAHGQHQAENALFSTLELAGGPLLGYDLQRAASVPSMVVLSSCDLGLTDVRPGDETFGMVTALLTAGATTVVASVARVADDTAMAAMISYHRAVTHGSAPAAALALGLERETAAGFVCFGAG